MNRKAIVAGAGALAVGAAVLLPMPAQSSDTWGAPPPRTPSFAGDVVIPPPGTPETRMPPIIRTRGSTTYQSGTYDVHVFAVPTDDGPAPWDEAEARLYVEELDAWFSAETSGIFRFRLAGFAVLPAYPGSLCGLGDAMDHARAEVDAIVPSGDGVDQLPVVVNPAPEDCTAAGQASLGSPDTWVGTGGDFGWDFATLAHEIGHNLGLQHSGAIRPGDLADPWGAGTAPQVEEYGDASDIMGMGGQYDCTSGSCVFRPSGLHNHNRNLLGAVPADRITAIPMTQSGEAAIVRLVAKPGGGAQVAYLPWRNRSKFALEFRPARGLDAHIADQDGPGAGVHVRVLGTGLDDDIPPYPAQAYGATGTISLPSGVPAREGASIPLGFLPGAATRLPDGTRIEVLEVTADSASVRVTRPADTTPPTMTVPRISYSGGSCTRYPCTVPAKASKKGKYRLWIAFGGFSDDQWVSSANALVNGDGGVGNERPAPDGTDEETALSPGSRDWGAWWTYRPGTYTIAYTYTDLAGNEGTSSYRVILPKP